eukprot:5577847-Prymnesium_polylepis.1
MRASRHATAARSRAKIATVSRFSRPLERVVQARRRKMKPLESRDPVPRRQQRNKRLQRRASASAAD